MKKLSQLHEEFIDNSRKPMSFGKLPVMPREADVPILPVDKWINKDDSMVRNYRFMSDEIRNEFVMELLEREETVGHHAKMTIDKENVTLVLQTKDVQRVTELDKEYARFADVTYKDVIHRVPNKKAVKVKVVNI